MTTEPPKIPAELKLARGVTSGRVQLVAVCRKMALEEGTTLDVMLWGVIKGLAYWAQRGDAACGKLVLGLLARDAEEAPASSSPDAGAKDAEVNGYIRSPEYAAEVARVLGELDEQPGDAGDAGDAAARLLR